MYLDILSPFRKLSLGFQQDLHNPVKAVRRIQEFTWTMAKLQLLIEMDLDSTESRLTSYKHIIQNVVQNEDDKTHKLQGVKLFNFKIVNDAV